ncbi:unnamed protein product [Durusdinium trenchii]|uniref:Protein tweety homolog n=1 Tax=Durusdinium trenchii TaxID=1381693 RepID=A0ABP0KIJ3_9DINO
MAWSTPSLAAWSGEFPPANSSGGQWEHFALESFRLSTVVFCVGILVSLFTLLILCKVHIRAHEQTRPCVMFLILLLANLGGLAVSGFLASFGSYGRAASTLSDLAVEIRDVQDMSAALNISSGSFQHNLDRLYTECPNTTHEFLGDSVTARKQEAREAQDTALVLLKQLSGIPQWLTQRTKDIISMAALVALSFGTPLVLLLISYLAICMLIGVAECAGPKCIRRCSCCQIACVAVSCISPTILLISIIVALELGFSMMSSAFCKNPTLVVLSYADVAFGHGSPTSNLTRQFLDKESAVMALKDMKVIQNHFALWQEWVGTYGDAIQRSCPTWDALNVSQNIQIMDAGLKTSLSILEPTHLYPYYNYTVDNLLCGTAISKMTVLMVFQLALGLLGLPVLACAASCLLDSLVAERTWELPEQSYLSESKHQRVMARNIELNSFANQQAMIRLPERLHVC